MSCEYSIQKFLKFTVATTPGLQQLCHTHRIPEEALVEAFETFTDAVRHSITEEREPTALQTSQYNAMMQMMSEAGVALPTHASSPRMKIILSSLYEMLQGVIKASNEGETDDSRVEMICRLARVGQTLNAVRPKVRPVLSGGTPGPKQIDPNTIGYGREDIERIAPHNPIAAVLLDAPPLPSPDWEGEGIARLREEIQARGAHIDLPTAEQVAAFLRDPNRIPRPIPMEPTENVALTADRLAINLSLWTQLIEDGYISADGRPSAQVPSSHLGGLMGFTLFGPPGTGKSEVLRQIAACLPWRTKDGKIRYGIPYVGLEVPPNGEFGEVLGRPTYDENGALWFKPGIPVIAAMCGAVVGFDELNRSNALALMLQGAWELGNDGRRWIRTPSPEGGLQIAFPVHAATIFGATYNPGLGGAGWSLPSAFVDRSTTLQFTSPSIEQQVGQVASMVRQLLQRQQKRKGPQNEKEQKEQEEMIREQIRTMLALVQEVNVIITRADQRLPLIEMRRAARLAFLALIGRRDLLEHELYSALPPVNHPMYESTRDSLEHILNLFRTNLARGEKIQNRD